MQTEWEGNWAPLPEDINTVQGVQEAPARLDSLFPSDSETGAVPFDALRVTLAAFMDLMARHEQPLTLLIIAADASESLRFLGQDGLRLIGRAMARWLRQETRIHDVVGRAEKSEANGVPAFLMVCPLMREEAAAQFAERLREAMTAYATEEGSPWLTLSVGVASLSLDASRPEDLLLRAEGALRSAQRAGGGRVWKHSDTLRRIIENHHPDTFDK